MLRTIAQFGLAVWMMILMCLVSLVYAAWFARRGGVRRLRVVIALSAGTFFTTLAGVLMGLVAVGRSIIAISEKGVAVPVSGLYRSSVTGVAESFAGGVLGFGTLTLIALLVAAAFWRGVPID
jgi:hypothetical protein